MTDTNTHNKQGHETPDQQQQAPAVVGATAAAETSQPIATKASSPSLPPQRLDSKATDVSNAFHDEHDNDVHVELDPNLEVANDNVHACAIERVAAFLKTDLTLGLTPEEAAARLEIYGPNKLKETPPPSFLMRVWLLWNNSLNWCMFFSAVASAGLESWPEFGLIMFVIIFNIVIGMVQEGKASAATAALKSMLSENATVIRGGSRMEVAAATVVPGDLVFVESGNKVPADIRLLSQSNLAVQEAMLTGESMPVNKNVENGVALLASLGDRKNMAYSATLCVKGQGFGIVTATGDNTEIGRIATLVQGVDVTKSNLMKQIDAFGRWIAMLVLPAAIVTFLIAYLAPVDAVDDNSGIGVPNITEDARARESVVIAIALAVSLIPAGLPAIMTICMALATTKLAKQGAIVKALPSVEVLGSVMVICSDKTGTLTKNEMTVVKVRTLTDVYDVTGVGYDPGLGQVQGGKEDIATQHLYRNGVLNNESRIDYDAKRVPIPIGDPSECALLCLAQKAGLVDHQIKAEHERIGVIPFESEHKFMVTFHKLPGNGEQALVVVKGAPDRLLPRASHSLDSQGQVVEIDPAFWTEQVVALSSMGFRVLALCETLIPVGSVRECTDQGPAYVSNRDRPAFLTFVGLVAILDPPRESCIPAIIDAHKAGVQVKMITGDHPQTAKSIGKTLGIVDEEHSEILTGPELDQMSLEDLKKVVMQVNVFARASPDNKITIVNALKAIDKVCSMTGDGVNDAPALRAADIGVAMGITGSDVSKDSAKMILSDDNFATIIVAVKEGRRVWDNLVKILMFNMPANFAQAGIIFFSVCLQWTVIPLTAIQILYINLITSCTLGFILAVEPAEKTVMNRPPRRKNKGLIGTLFYWRCLYVATTFIFFVLGAVSWVRNYDSSVYDAKAQHSQAFNTLIFCEISYAFSCRFLKLSSFHPRIFGGNPGAWLSAFLMAGLNVLVTYVPGLNDFFDMSPMDGMQWGIVFLFGFLTLVIVELEKALSEPLRPYTQPWIRKMKRITCCSCCRKRGDPLMEEEDAEEDKEQAAAPATLAEVRV